MQYVAFISSNPFICSNPLDVITTCHKSPGTSFFFFGQLFFFGQSFFLWRRFFFLWTYEWVMSQKDRVDAGFFSCLFLWHRSYFPVFRRKKRPVSTLFSVTWPIHIFHSNDWLYDRIPPMSLTLSMSLTNPLVIITRSEDKGLWHCYGIHINMEFGSVAFICGSIHISIYMRHSQ